MPGGSTQLIPMTPIQRWTRPLAQFLKIESASGGVLFLCTILALVLANSHFGHDFQELLHLPLKLEVGSWVLKLSLGHFINDGLMAIFFFVVGLEIKRELVIGELREPRKAALPVMAALGGMIVPAGIYYALQAGQPGARGWGVPMATDIAFVVGVMTMFGSRVPFGLKILLLSLAIADDIGAVVVIALFYSSGLKMGMLGAAAVGFGLVLLMRWVGVRSVPIYFVVGVVIWYLVYESGIHPTVAGVLFGLMTPSSAHRKEAELLQVLRYNEKLLTNDPDLDEHARSGALEQLAYTSREAVSPLYRLERALHPWVGFLIMPIFALANAGVEIDPAAITQPVTIAVALGLVLGKPIGVLLFCAVAIKLGIGRLPDGVTWPVLAAGGCLAGIGFTMSLFVAGLGLPPELLPAGKLGTLLGSLISAVLGSVLLLIFSPRRL
ncbi:MAG: Na+/H+ antiporter NhaA [Gemmataceae bacterium]